MSVDSRVDKLPTEELTVEMSVDSRVDKLPTEELTVEISVDSRVDKLPMEELTVEISVDSRVDKLPTEELTVEISVDSRVDKLEILLSIVDLLIRTLSSESVISNLLAADDLRITLLPLRDNFSTENIFAILYVTTKI